MTQRDDNFDNCGCVKIREWKKLQNITSHTYSVLSKT